MAAFSAEQQRLRLQAQNDPSCEPYPLNVPVSWAASSDNKGDEPQSKPRHCSEQHRLSNARFAGSRLSSQTKLGSYVSERHRFPVLTLRVALCLVNNRDICLRLHIYNTHPCTVSSSVGGEAAGPGFLTDVGRGKVARRRGGLRSSNPRDKKVESELMGRGSIRPLQPCILCVILDWY